MPADSPALRRCVLAVSVIGDLDLRPDDAGVVLEGPPAVLVTWAQIAAAVAPYVPGSGAAHRRLDRWLRLRWVIAHLGPQSTDVLRAAARLVALPYGHVDHAGDAWVREVLPGGALDIGLGVHGLARVPELSHAHVLHMLGPLAGAEEVTTLDPGVLAAGGLDVGAWWSDVHRHADRMGALAAARLARDARSPAADAPAPRGRLGRAVLRPVGGCDVLALLASPALRGHLAAGDGTGMRAVAVPTRRRGWFDLSTVDPAFVATAWSATAEGQRGLPTPVLVTRHGVSAPRGRPPTP